MSDFLDFKCWQICKLLVFKNVVHLFSCSSLFSRRNKEYMCGPNFGPLIKNLGKTTGQVCRLFWANHSLFVMACRSIFSWQRLIMSIVVFLIYEFEISSCVIQLRSKRFTSENNLKILAETNSWWNIIATVEECLASFNSTQRCILNLPNAVLFTHVLAVWLGKHQVSPYPDQSTS